jgi:hypothetical protein
MAWKARDGGMQLDLFAIEDAGPVHKEQPAEKVSDSDRRLQRQATEVSNGIHPITRSKIHPEATRSLDFDRKRAPYTCGSCMFRRQGGNRGDLPLCIGNDGRFEKNTPTYMVRPGFPACTEYQEFPK